MSPGRTRPTNLTARSRTTSARKRTAAVAAAPAHGRRERRKHATHRELLEAGRKLFGEQGLYDCRIEDLSRHAGIAKGTLYGYFDGKEDLMAAVVSVAFDELLGAVHRATRDARTSAARIEGAARAHLEFFDANPDLLRIFHQVRGLLKYGRAESRVLRPVITGYLRGLAQAMADQTPGARRDPQQDLESAIAFFGAVSGIASTRAALPELLAGPTDRDASARALVAFVLAHEGRPTT